MDLEACGDKRFVHRSVIKVLISLCVVGSVLSPSFPVSAWDNTYGERDDRSSFSGIEAVLADDAGGIAVAGWFWGDFEGLRSLNACRSFVMRILPDGSTDWITDFPYPRGGECWNGGYEIAPGENDTFWVSPGPSGGLALVGEDGIVSSSSEYSVVKASNDRGFIVEVLENFFEYSVRSPSGVPSRQFSFVELLMDQGLQPATEQWSRKLTILSDEENFYVAGYFVENFPFSNEDYAIFKMDMDGDVIWSTVLDRRSSVCGNAFALTKDYLTVAVGSECSEWEYLLISKSNGSVREGAADEVQGLCTTSNPLVATPKRGGECPLGSEPIDLEITGPEPGLVVLNAQGSSADNVIYTPWDPIDTGSSDDLSLPVLGRWALDGSMWRLEAALFPFGTDGAQGNKIADVDVNSAGSTILGGSLGRAATISPGLRTRSQLYSAVLSTRVMQNVVGARPSRPRSLESKRRDDDKIKLSWTAPRWPGGKIVDYVVQRRTSEGRWKTIPGAVSARPAMLLPLQRRGTVVRVVAKNQAGLGFAAKHRISK